MVNLQIKAGTTDNAGWTFSDPGKSSPEGDADGLSANDKGEGYYLDIPVWFRTTNVSDVSLGVDVTVTDPNEKGENAGDLFKATRVAILNSDKTSAAGGVFLGAETDVNSYYQKKAVVATNGTGVEDYYGNISVAKEVSANSAGQVTNSGDVTTVATVTGVGNGNTGYSTPVQYYIRVWLEGEDEHCWNANAGQSFNVDLKFYDLSNTGAAD